jgi:hypothetical protein
MSSGQGGGATEEDAVGAGTDVAVAVEGDAALPAPPAEGEPGSQEARRGTSATPTTHDRTNGDATRPASERPFQEYILCTYLEAAGAGGLMASTRRWSSERLRS